MKNNYDIHVPFSTYIVKHFQIKAKIKTINKMKNIKSDVVIGEIVHGEKIDKAIIR